MAGEIVDVIQGQPNHQAGPTRRCTTKAPFHLVVDERPFENQLSLRRRQPDVHELSRLDPLAPHSHQLPHAIRGTDCIDSVVAVGHGARRDRDDLPALVECATESAEVHADDTLL